MLINLSNHPSDKWGLKQTNVSIAKFGHTEDMKFPQIDPEADVEHVMKIANDYANECLMLFSDYKLENPNDNYPDAVHIQGEFTFVFAFVGLMHKHSVECVASTTKRTVVEETNGQKTSVFEFVQFRPYRSEWEIPF